MYFLIEYKVWPWLGTYYTRGIIKAETPEQAAKMLGRKIIAKDHSLPNSFIIDIESKEHYDFSIRIREIKPMLTSEELDIDYGKFKKRAESLN